MDVFVYGTLTDPEQVGQVLTEYGFGDDAVLEGLHRETGTYPTLAPGGSVAGRLLRTPDIDRLDRYEGVERGLYVRVAVPVERDPGNPEDFNDHGDANDPDELVKPAEPASPETAAVYVGDPVALDVEAEIEWSGEGTFRTRVERYVREYGVRVQRW